MATQLTTRITDGLGATVKNAPLTNGELDNNFLSLNSNKLEVSNNLSDIASKSAARANLEVPSRSGGNAFGTWSISITGSAAESLKLKDSFNLTIGSETLAVDGSENVSFTLANIGAVSDSLIIEAGSGLTGGGTLTQSRTVNLGTPGTITGATTNSTTANSHTHEISLSAADVGAAPVTRQIISGDGLSGGGTLAANRTLSVDSTVVRTSREIATGDGLQGGGNLTANRELSVDSTILRVDGNGSQLTNLNGSSITSGTVTANRIGNLPASKITSGTISTARLGSGTASVNTFLRGDGSWSQIPPSLPVGATYIQFPGRPAPSTLFGGSWTAIFDNEGVFFRTPGGEASSFGAGIQSDQMQRITGSVGNSRWRRARWWREVGALSAGPDGGQNQNASGSGDSGSINFDSRNSPNSRASSVTSGETRPRNRTVRVWVRTS